MIVQLARTYPNIAARVAYEKDPGSEGMSFNANFTGMAI